MLSLYPYQHEAVDWIHKHDGRGIIAYELGTGKTCITLKSLPKLLEGRKDKGVLVICPKVAFGVWQLETKRWLGVRSTIWTGLPWQRTTLWNKYAAGKGGFMLITNFAQLPNILQLKRKWSAIIVDEAHLVRNRKTIAFRALQKFISPHVLLLTGTPVVNGVQDLWTLLNLIDRGLHRSYWQFVSAHCLTEINAYGTRQVVGLINPKGTQRHLKPYLIRKTKLEVLKELPPLIRQPVPVVMEGEQLKMYNQIARQMIAETADGGLLMVPNRIAQLTRLRQILVNPALVGGHNKSAIFDALEESLRLDFEAGISALVFTPFAAALPLIAERIAPFTDFQETIRGGMKPGIVSKKIADFQGHPSKRKALLCSLLVGSSFTATAASSVYFVGYDYVPANNFQAEGRAHRAGQENQVHVKYFMVRGSIDQHILRILDRKTTWSQLALDPRTLLLPDPEDALD